MSRHLTFTFAYVFSLASISQGVEPVSSKVESLVQSALQAEADGDFLTRDQLLATAAASEPGSEKVRWAQGYIRNKVGEWMTIDDLCEQQSSDAAILAYHQRREQLADTLPNHFALARWCSENGLPLQMRAHLERVIAMDSDHAAARSALGHRLVSGEWVDESAIVQLTERALRTKESLQTHGAHLRSIRAGMENSNGTLIATALSQLRSIDDPQAVLAAEVIFANAPPSSIQQIVQWLATVDSVESSQSLLRIAYGTTDIGTRSLSVSELRKRPYHDFAPELLSMLSSPIGVMNIPTFDGRGQITGYRQILAQEEQDRTKVLVTDSQVQRSTFWVDPTIDGGRPNQAQLAVFNAERDRVEANVRSQIALEASTRTNSLRRANANIVRRNERVATLLSEIVQKELSSNPNEMWQWWDSYNDTEYQRYKPSRYRRSLTTRVAPSLQLERPSCECFVAGTLVLTSSGLRPIESVAVGDTVFSRNQDTGELCIRPVIRATRRPPSSTVSVQIDQDTLQCTDGHLFWISGEGWKKAKDLRPGDTVHSAGYPAVVSKVSPSDDAPTFNLRIADTCNYFVGNSRVLSRDVTPKRSTRIRVPGLRVASTTP